MTDKCSCGKPCEDKTDWCRDCLCGMEEQEQYEFDLNKEDKQTKMKKSNKKIVEKLKNPIKIFGTIFITLVSVIILFIILDVSFEFGDYAGYELRKFYSGNPYSYFEFKAYCDVIAVNVKETEETFIIPVLFGSGVLVKKEWNTWNRKGEWICLYKPVK